MSKHRLLIEVDCDDKADKIIEEYLDWKADAGRQGIFGGEIEYMLQGEPHACTEELQEAERLAYASKVSAAIFRTG